MGFCPICGKDTDKTFCEEHTPNDLEYKDIVVRICECKRYFYRNQWLPFQNLKKIAEKISKENIKGLVKINALIDEKIEKKKFEIEVIKNSEKFIIPAKIQVERCPTCSKMGSNYFESIIQLRPRDEELVQFVKQQVDKDPHAFISKIVGLKEGYDLYCSSNSFSKKMGKRLSQSFKGKVTVSSTLHTRDKQTSKDLYRVTVLFRRDE